jgi:hypothetical protein
MINYWNVLPLVLHIHCILKCKDKSLSRYQKKVLQNTIGETSSFKCCFSIKNHGCKLNHIQSLINYRWPKLQYFFFLRNPMHDSHALCWSSHWSKEKFLATVETTCYLIDITDQSHDDLITLYPLTKSLSSSFDGARCPSSAFGVTNSYQQYAEQADCFLPNATNP